MATSMGIHHRKASPRKKGPSDPAPVLSPSSLVYQAGLSWVFSTAPFLSLEPLVEPHKGSFPPSSQWQLLRYLKRVGWLVGCCCCCFLNHPLGGLFSGWKILDAFKRFSPGLHFQIVLENTLQLLKDSLLSAQNYRAGHLRKGTGKLCS